MKDDKKKRINSTNKVKRFTSYLDSDACDKLHEIYAWCVISRNRKTKGDIVCEAIKLLYKRYVRKHGK